ncbi:MAG: hypothetical protein E7H05_02680 [Veillonella sp.]|nr:hypothetical protein [Veillonella sp.]
MKLEYADTIEIVRKSLSKFIKEKNISKEVYDQAKRLSDKTALPNIIKENFAFNDNVDKYVLLNEFVNNIERLISSHATMSDYESDLLRDIIENAFNEVTRDL